MWRKLLIGLVGLGMLAQLLVPVGMLLKHHLILTRGEKVTVDVTFYDPRDLFMGHYVQLSIAEDTPPALEGAPKNYLRYYCDQRYAKAIDVGVRKAKAELDVRVWRGSALAEELRIDGIPAYEYVDKKGNAASNPIESEPEDAKRPDVESVVCVEAARFEKCPPLARFAVVGKNLTWTTTNADEGFFFRCEGSSDLVAGEVLEVYQEGVGYLIRPSAPLLPQKQYNLIFKYRRGDKVRRVNNWHTFYSCSNLNIH